MLSFPFTKLPTCDAPSIPYGLHDDGISTLVGYIDEEVSVTRTKLAQMEIAEASLAREQEGDAGPSRSD